MEFSFIDNFFYFLLSFFNSQYATYLMPILVCTLMVHFVNPKIKLISFIFLFSTFVFTVIYSHHFFSRICKDNFNLDSSQCGFEIGNNPESNENRVFLKINRNLESKYKNGIFLGKKEPSFEIKQESYFIEIPKDFKIKNNNFETFLKKNNQVVKDRIRDFLNFKEGV